MTIPVQSTKEELTVSVAGTAFTFTLEYTDSDVDNFRVWVNDVEQASTYSIVDQVITFTFTLDIGDVILIVLTNAYSRTFDFTNSSEWNSTTVNAQLDLLELQIQQLKDLIFIKSVINETTTFTIPDIATRANKTLAFDSNGDLTVI
jgi:hypothetical protein